MTAIKSVKDLIAELTTVENGLMFAHEYHTQEARKNAAAHATWSVRYPPIVQELEAAQSSAGRLRDYLADALKVEEELTKILDRFAPKPSDHAPSAWLGFDGSNTVPCATEDKRPAWEKEYERLRSNLKTSASGRGKF